MPPTDTRSQAAFDAAIRNIRTTLQAVFGRVCDGLAAAAQTHSARVVERDLCHAALHALRGQADTFHRRFAQVLRDKLVEELTPRAEASRQPAAAKWQTLSLVGDDEIEERLFADRIGQTIAHACDAELRDLAPYTLSLLAGSGGRAAPERNPLRAEMLGAPLCRAIEAVCREPAERQLLTREFGQAMARAMPACYAAILQDLQARGIQPAALTARGVEGPGAAGGNSGYSTLDAPASGRGRQGDVGPSTTAAPGESGSGSAAFHRGSERAGHNSRIGGHTGEPGSSGGGADALADAQLMALLRRLSALVGTDGDDSGPGLLAGSRSTLAGATGATRPQITQIGRIGQAGDSRPAPAGSPRAMPGSFDPTLLDAGLGRPSRSAALADPPDGGRRGIDSVGELMAVNLIRAHRDELLQASTGQLDHMVIDVVGSLFDQILSDARVPPQMARQIARLQLPVLRVALRDRSFFSSRRHPVRRFVNRIASLACAFDDFADGPGLDFLDRVGGLVQEIVDGDFDQIELYTAQLAELERFIAEQAAAEVERNGTRVTLENKETELRLQQRYLLQLQAALGPLALPAYLGDFLSQVWSQALVLAASREGATSERSQRFRRAGRDLVMSVQPKGSPAMRQKFLMQLPPLMKDLGDGLRLVGWPDEAQAPFFAKLRPAQAESLKARPMSELDHNLLVKQLDAIFHQPLPNAHGTPASPLDEALAADATAPAAVPLEERFTPEEARSVGLVDESAIDWSNTLDIDLGADSETAAGGALPGPLEGGAAGGQQVDLYLDLMMADAPAARGTAVDVDLGGGPGGDTGAGTDEAGEPARGPQLMAQIQLGFAYQMHLKESWQKVRLTHVSPGRNFFVFSRGRRHQETISMTARMLARMCETGRLRAVESAYLMERATQRARRQLAAMRAPAAPA